MKRTLVLVLAAVMVLGVAGAAFADTVVYPGAPNGDTPPKQEAAGTVTVKASVNPKITLSITTPDAGQEVDFGAVDPETSYTDTVGLEVKSNKDWDMAVVKGGDEAELGLTTTYEAGLTGVSKGTWTQNDTYTLLVPFTTDPGAHVATVQYTVTQQ